MISRAIVPSHITRSAAAATVPAGSRNGSLAPPAVAYNPPTCRRLQEESIRALARFVTRASLALTRELSVLVPRPVAVPGSAELSPVGPAICWPALLKPAAGLLVLLLLSAGVLLAPIDLEAFGAYGYPGLFLITLLTTGSFVLPIPYLAVVFKAGTLLDPLGVALVAGLAAALGELSGYLLGYLGREAVGDQRWRQRAERWIRRHGFLTTLVLSFVPNPIFDAAGVAAGALRYPVSKFAAACFLGKAAKFLVIAAWGNIFF